MAQQLTNSIGNAMVSIKGGTFLMGSDLPPAKWDESPVHRVSITKAFSISQRRVSLGQFRRFRPGFPGGQKPGEDATGVSWSDAVAFCRWISEKEGLPYRLPTEAEWEYLAAGDHGHIEDMLGGAREWCLDWYGDYAMQDQVDPVGPERGVAKVIRGGGLDEESPRSPAEEYLRPSNRAAMPPSFGLDPDSPNAFGAHAIGFRLVLGEAPAGRPFPVHETFVRQCVKGGTNPVGQGPDPSKPYFRKRPLLPVPPDNSSREEIDAAGLHPSFRGHNHSPALEVCPNGDLLLVIYTSYREYEPEVSLIASRLRFGADQWDMPTRFIDFPNVNDHAPLLWNDAGTLHLFWGNPRLPGAYPFQWTSSRDSGGSWDEVVFPHFPGEVGPHSRQPINTAFRDSKGVMHVASDAQGGTSVLWASHDQGRTWVDTRGRSAGRHTTYALLGDGSLLGMGGKNTDIDGFMPKAISRDGGRTWEAIRTPFCSLGSNQRPSMLRLASGRLFFAGDYQRRDGYQPPGISQRGAYVALSEDEGDTWTTKRLPAAQMHENPKVAEEMGGETIGYSVARQGPNGIIHLVTTMNHPCLHFEMNEAWIMDRSEATAPTRSRATHIVDLRASEERYANGHLRSRWSGGVADDGRYLLHGPEVWFYPDGGTQWVAEYSLGRKVGKETYWLPDGSKLWEWQHDGAGGGIWSRWRGDGSRTRSEWRKFRCQGTATIQDASGRVTSELSFRRGRSTGTKTEV
jgi:hypothetical protein